MPSFFQRSLPVLYGAYFNCLSYLSGSITGKQAFLTFSKVRKGRVQPQQYEFLEKARNGILSVNGHELQTYHWPGSGETVLLVHGWESNSYRWHKLIEQLQLHDFNIMAFDAPGHGYSSGEYLHVPLYGDCLLNMIQKHRPRHLVAHSMGGMTSLYMHYKHPDSGVEKIVTIGSPSEFHEMMEHYRSLLKLNQRVLKALDTYVVQHFGFHIREFSTSRFANSIPQKGLLFHDKSDPITPFHASEKVHANWVDSTLVSTEGLGHSMHQDSVNKRIVDFLVSGK
jgi:pimeloyl-ACP methyl ester carboxylesterase